MARRGVEEHILELSRLRDTPITETTLAALRKGLAAGINLVSAKAAQVAGDLGANALIPDLAAAFPRFFRNGSQSDPQCWAKNAIAKALTVMGHDASSTFLPGCSYVQLESVWGGKTDTAVTLRSLCTLALVQCADLPRAHKFRHLIASMTDGAETVRMDAIRAIEQMEGEEAVLLLRLKAGIRDSRAAVTGQALESLLRLEGERGLDFVQDFLEEKPRENLRELPSTAEEMVEEAALALGASRFPAAVELLKDAWKRQPRIVFLQAISVSREEGGFAFLLDLVTRGRERDAAAAVEALALHRDSMDVRVRIGQAIEERGSAALHKQFCERYNVCPTSVTMKETGEF